MKRTIIFADDEGNSYPFCIIYIVSLDAVGKKGYYVTDANAVLVNYNLWRDLYELQPGDKMREIIDNLEKTSIAEIMGDVVQMNNDLKKLVDSIDE